MVEIRPPIGLLAYAGGRVVGWCAAGPRERYAQALRSPLLKGREAAEDGSVWFFAVPVRPGR
jgi:hypothetical protein